MAEKKQIEKLHENAVKVVLTGLENPDITVKELLDMCESNLK